MNKIRILSLICLVIGIVFFAFGFYKGNVEGGIIVIFPYIAGTGIYALLGFIFFILAFFLFIYSFKTNIEFFNEIKDEKTGKKTSFKGGGVVLIGPIPIVFGSNLKIAILLMIISIIIILLTENSYFINDYFNNYYLTYLLFLQNILFLNLAFTK
jgi:uncharacterized protein (TIGR00304 family)